MDNPAARVASQISAALQAFPPILTTVILVAGALAVAAILHAVIKRIVSRWSQRRHDFMVLTFLGRAERLLFFALAVGLVSSIVPATPLSPNQQIIALRFLSAGFIGIVGWAALVAIDVVSERQLARTGKNIQDDAMARKHATQWQVLRRTSHVVLALLTIAAALMVFPAVQKYGVSILASAGAAGLVLGLAARPVLSNLIAGIQLAITQPIRIEDAVIINNEWGWIEEITATYVVVRIWNWQRMIVPLAWLLEQPFQNWTRSKSELIGVVVWHVDYRVPVDPLRKKLEEIVRSTKLWDGNVVVLQVTETHPATMELRALVSARNSGEAWDLRCYVREKMIQFLQVEYPHGLPRQRIELDEPAAKRDPAGEGATAQRRPAHERQPIGGRDSPLGAR
ncbi:MAG: mechanosensitive ion channel family protein [Stellaceae bacterium]